MTVGRAEGERIVLLGECPSEDAEALLQHLLATPSATVDLRGCTRAHAAVVQVLMASSAPVQGPAGGAFLRRWVEPTLRAR